MKYLIPVLVIATIFIFNSCKTTEYSPDDYPNQQIIFGSGGGFAGTYTDYHLFENGMLFKKISTDTTYQKVKRLKKDEVTQIFKNFEVLNLQNYKLNDPGNMNYYMEFKTKDGGYKIHWGGNNQPVDTNVKTIYQILNNFLK